MNKNDMTVASLAASEHFQDYCLHPTAKTTQYWEDWLGQHPEHKTLFAEAKETVQSLALEPSETEIKAAFIDFKAAIEKRQSGTQTKLVAISKQRKTRKINRKFIAVAASVAFILAFGFWQYLIVPATSTVQLATNYGEVQTHTLPDGSKVILNANSTLTYNSYWPTNSPRKVQLQGEAFFEVKQKSQSEQFSVQTAKGNINVLGTSFNVFQRMKTLEVALLEGAVELAIPKYPIIKMEPGELVQLEGSDAFDRRIADVDAFSAWRFKRIVFKELTIARVIQRLQDEFDWTITVADQALLKRKITATIPKNDPGLLLEALSEIYDLEIKQLDNKAYLIK